jgi:predicted Ser/Thr protein kinase
MENLTGKQLRSYQIVEPLGEGGMAAVYKAYQPGMERYVALKILPRHFASDPEFVGRFEQEAKVLAKLQHPHILPVFDFGEADGYTYIVMPFLESGDLNDLLRGQPLSLPQIRRLISQLGDALDYAHQRGLIHRDVKPSNVLLDERGNCLLMDFGIAKMVAGSTKFTATGGLIGTPAYMSPEQGLGRKLDGRSDIYALGIMLYEMATGRVPYRAETPMAVVVKHISDPLPPPRQINPDLPEAIERVILKALAKQPEDRYQTAGEMVRALQAAIPDTIMDEILPVDEEATIISTAGPTREARIQEAAATAADRKTSRSGLIWILAAVAVAIVFIGAIAFFTTRGRQEEIDTRAVTAAMATAEQAQADATKLLAEATEASLTATAVSPTDTPLPTAKLTTAIDTDPSLYDDFNDPTFDGSFNQGRWQKSSSTVGDLIQQDGVLVATQDGEPEGWSMLVLRKYDYVQLNTPIFFETKLMLDPVQYSGDVRFSLGTQLPGDKWWASECKIYPHNEREAWAACLDTDASNQADHWYDGGGKTVDYGTWHTFRIEIDPASMAFIYYIDGHMTGSHVPADAEELKQAKFLSRVGVSAHSSDRIVGYIDDVRIGQFETEPVVNVTDTPPAATLDTDPTVYDDFNDPAYGGSFNQDQWIYWSDPPNQIVQQDGILVVTQEGKKPGDSTGLAAHKYDNVQLNVPTFFEAKLMLGPVQHAGNVQLQLYADWPRDEEDWFSECSISFSGDQELPWASCYDSPGLAQDGHEYSASMKIVDYGTWHRVRIEVDPATMMFTYYIDGEMVGSHVAVDAEELKGARFTLGVGVWSSSSEVLTGYIDDVRIGPLDEQSLASQSTPMPTSTPKESPLPTQPTPTPTPSIWIDDFDDALDPAWSWLNEDPTYWSLTNAPGSLRIITQGESLYNTGQPSNLLFRDAPQGNFQIVAKVTLNPTDNFQQAAILIYQDEDNFVLLSRGFCGEEGCVGSGVYLDREINGEVDFGGPREPLSLQTIILGLRKEGTRYIGYYSTDGENWTALGALEHPMTPTKVGLTANNANSDPGVPQIPVDFDFFAIREF